jgi:hypothetical protein
VVTADHTRQKFDVLKEYIACLIILFAYAWILKMESVSVYFLAANPKVPSSIPDITRFSE